MANAALLPPNTTPLERNLAEVCADACELPVPLREAWSPADCPVALLPWLAWSFGVEEWDERWNEDQKRAVIAASIHIKRIKGTIGAVRRAIAALGITARVQEWFAQIPAGEPHTYRLRLEVDQVGYDLELLERMLKVVDNAKNLRSHLDTVIPSVVSRSTLHCGAVAVTGHEISVAYGAPTYSDGTPAIDLLTDAALHGESGTIAAIERLHTLTNTTIPGYFG